MYENILYFCSMLTFSTHITTHKLIEIAEISSGVYLQASPAGTIACLQVKDLLNDSPEATEYKVEYSKKLDRYLLQQGDILFASKGYTYLCKVFDSDITAVASTTLYSIRLQTENISPEYLCWYLNHPQIVSKIKSEQVGTGTPLIRKQIIENIEIPIPDKATQKQIVELAKLQKREEELIHLINYKKNQITNQLIMNKLNKYGK